MKKSSFTLVELLVAIGIILILTGILLPAVSSSIKKGEVTKCKSEIHTLLMAIKQYEATYHTLCGATSESGTDYGDLIEALQGANIRKIKFLEVKDNEEGEYKDPWGNNYHVLLDSNYDDKISSIPDGLNASTLHYSVFIWSKGPDGDSSSTKSNKTNKDNVYSVPTIWSKDDGHNIQK